MFDSKKLDSYFDGNNTFVSHRHKKSAFTFSWNRFIRLGFPCIAAALLGLMVVLPNIKKSAEIENNITLPRKNEMEKLHVEQVVMNSTDKKNRVSTVWSDNMDELEVGSDEIKISSPRAEIPSDNGLIKISSDIGFVNQKTKVLRLKDNVKITDEKGNIVNTSDATYEFETEYGYGDDEVQAEGNWGTLTAEKFNYDKNSGVLTLIGKTVIETTNGTLISHNQTKYFQNEDKTESEGKAMVKKDDKTLYADKITNYFSGGAKKELKKTEAVGNVEIVTPKGRVKGNRADYNLNTGAAEVFGNVNIITEKGVAKGSHAVYDSKRNTVDLYGDVVLEQGDNFMHGHHAHTDLNTSVSTMKADKTQGARVSGTFYNKRKAKNGEKTK